MVRNNKSLLQITMIGTIISMTQLLSHTIAHFTGPSFMLWDNNQPNKKKFSSCVHSCKFRQKTAHILENKVL